MPPEYNWMAEAKDPSMGKRGSRGTHTNTPAPQRKRLGGTDVLLSSILDTSSAHPLVIHGGVVVCRYIPSGYVSDRATGKHKCKRIAFIQLFWK